MSIEFHNYFFWVLAFKNAIDQTLGGEDSHRLADHMVQLGVGSSLPTTEVEEMMNEVVLHLINEAGIRQTLFSILKMDSMLEESHPRKIVTKGFEESLLNYLGDTPDPRFFPKNKG